MTSSRPATLPSNGGLMNPKFSYTPAANTNVAKRFRAIREQSKPAPANVKSISAIRGKV